MGCGTQPAAVMPRRRSVQRRLSPHRGRIVTRKVVNAKSSCSSYNACRPQQDNRPRGRAMPRKPKTTGPKAGGERQGGENTQGYFRRVFKENPKLLTTRSNDELLKRWLADHPGETEVPKSVKNGLQNVKSILRSKGRKRRAARAAAAAAGAPARLPGSRDRSGLEVLEEQIDECLTAARAMDRDGLQDVIDFLRRARNAV